MGIYDYSVTWQKIKIVVGQGILLGKDVCQRSLIVCVVYENLKFKYDIKMRIIEDITYVQ